MIFTINPSMANLLFNILVDSGRFLFRKARFHSTLLIEHSQKNLMYLVFFPHMTQSCFRILYSQWYISDKFVT